MSPAERETRTTQNRCQLIKPKTLKKLLMDNLMLVITLAGVLFGIALGLSLRSYRLGPDALMIITYPGELFMRLLELIILPLIVASLIAGSASLNAKMSGKIAVRTLLCFILTSMFNVLLGIALAMAIHPGQQEKREEYGPSIEDKKDHTILDSILDIGRNIFPDNIVQATFQQAHTVYTERPTANNSLKNNTPTYIRVVTYIPGTNTLGLVFFCLVFGSLLGNLGAKGLVVIDFFQAIFEVIMKMVTGIMWLTPVGVASIIAGKIMEVNDIAQVMSQLAWFIITVTTGVFFYQLIVLQLLYFIYLRKNPYKFYWGLSQATLTAFATASTAAALPATFKAMEGPLQIDPRITRFVLPIGCNINMDGTALFLGAAGVFVCQMNNIPLGFAKLATIFLTSTVASASAAAVPSAGMVLLLVVLAAIDAPTHDVSLLFAVEWLVDRIRTTNNMLDNCYTAAIVEHLSKNELMNFDAIYEDPLNSLIPITDMGNETARRYSLDIDEVIIDVHNKSNRGDSNQMI